MFQSVDQTRRKRLKVAAACTECRRKKTKCNGEQPCVGCQKAHVSCEYNNGQNSTTASLINSQAPHHSSRLLTSQPALFVHPRAKQLQQIHHHQQHEDTIQSIEQRLVVIEDILKALLASVDTIPRNASHIMHTDGLDDNNHVPVQLAPLLSNGSNAFSSLPPDNVTAAAAAAAAAVGTSATRRGQKRQHSPPIVPSAEAVDSPETSYHRHQHHRRPSIHNLLAIPAISPSGFSSTSSNHSSSSSISPPPSSSTAWSTIDKTHPSSQILSSPTFRQQQPLHHTLHHTLPSPQISSAFQRVHYSTTTSPR